MLFLRTEDLCRGRLEVRLLGRVLRILVLINPGVCSRCRLLVDRNYWLAKICASLFLHQDGKLGCRRSHVRWLVIQLVNGIGRLRDGYRRHFYIQFLNQIQRAVISN